MQKFVQNKKNTNLQPNISYLGIFRLKFEKKVMFEISTLEFTEKQSFLQI